MESKKSRNKDDALIDVESSQSDVLIFEVVAHKNSKLLRKKMKRKRRKEEDRRAEKKKKKYSWFITYTKPNNIYDFNLVY